jgi:pSer/pThr/pTyr-binding forkhead associated (FHA) protein
MSEQKHLLIIEDDSGSRQLVLDSPVYSIGRDRTCTIRLASFFVSRHHATLVQVRDEQGQIRYQIVDGTQKGAHSVNGLRVNGRRLQCHYLRNEDRVEFGPQVQFTYYLLKRDQPITEPTGEFDDVTLINPRTVEEKSAVDVDLSSTLKQTYPRGAAHNRGSLIRQRLAFVNFRHHSNLRVREHKPLGKGSL